MDVSVIIVNWNAAAVLPACLASLPAALGELTSEIWVVDNASTDGSPAMVEAQFPQVSLLANNVNSGFAAANNQAASQASGRYLLLLNPDTISPPGAFEKLVRFADLRPDVGCAGPRLAHSDGRYQRSAWYGFPGLGMALMDAFYLWKIPRLPLARQIELDPDKRGEPVSVDHLLGACLLIRRETWQQVGGLDEAFFLFLEETDWCYRARHAGWQIVYQPAITITHLGEHSVNQNPVRNLPQFYGSYCQFYRKHTPASQVRLVLLKTVLAAAAGLRITLWRARAIARHGADAAQARAMEAGYRQVLRKLPRF
jgi:N-acetylglucosaminyl-diphospho-decaprenol L-rhamnosyltransferase